MANKEVNDYLFLRYGDVPYKVRAINSTDAIKIYGRTKGIKDDIFEGWVYDPTIDGLREYFNIKKIEYKENEITNIESFDDEEIKLRILNFFEDYTDKSILEDFYKFCKGARYEFNDSELFYIWSNVEKGWGASGIRFLDKNEIPDYDSSIIAINLGLVEEVS